MNDSANRVQLFFGEGPQPDDPSYLTRWLEVPVTPILGTKPQKPITWTWNETKDGLACTLPGAGAWEMTHTYGVLKRSDTFLLVYSAKAVLCQPPETSDALRVRLPSEGFSIEPQWDGKQLELVFFEDGKPAAHLEVNANTSEGSMHFSTDDSGRYRFETPVSGVVSFRVAKTIDRKGIWEGEEYNSVRHHTTFCVRVPSTTSAAIKSQDTTTLPALPLALTSFGATRHDSRWYVYGGHTGEAHSYAHDEQCNQLFVCDSKDLASWKAIAEGPRVQGNALVHHGAQIILVGGFTAQNASGEPAHLVSQNKVMAWDLEHHRWHDLPSLPEPRSSMDAIVVDHHLFVMGGWTLSGDSKNARWLATAWKLDLNHTEAGWQPIAPPPVQRRAIALVADGVHLLAIGGMTSQSGPTTAVYRYSIEKNEWIQVGSLLGSPMNGFGASACQVGDRIIVTTMDGSIQAWNSDRRDWDLLGYLQQGRFFHRILPIDDRSFAIIGGANMEIGKFTDTARVQLTSTHRSVPPTAR